MVFLCLIVSCSCHKISRRQTRPSLQSSSRSSLSQQPEPPTSNAYDNPQLRESTIINSIQELALDISATQWDQGNVGNVVLSPVSISALLSLILLGTRGNSHSELKRALRYPNNLPDATIHETFQKILGSIGQTEIGVNVTMGSRLFLQEGLSILGTYTQIAQALYDSKVRGLDFARNPSGSTDAVNKWVEETTNGLIVKLLSQPFSPQTKFVGVNTIYFNGEWEYPFSKRLTYPGTFNTGNRNITIPMMTTLVNVPYLKGDQIGFDMIQLPYKGGKYAMIIMTPQGHVNLQSLLRVEYALDAKIIEQLIQRMKPSRVSVTIPKMKLTHKLFLKKDLKSLGVNDIFEFRKSDFGRLTTDSEIYLNDVVHQAVIEVTETGTKAAAASASSIDRIGSSDYFLFNRPSIVLIKDLASSLTLFHSRVFDPEPIN